MGGWTLAGMVGRAAGCVGSGVRHGACPLGWEAGTARVCLLCPAHDTRWSALHGSCRTGILLNQRRQITHKGPLAYASAAVSSDWQLPPPHNAGLCVQNRADCSPSALNCSPLRQDRVDARQRLAQRVRAEAATHAAAAAAAKVAKTALSDSEEEEGEEGDSRGDLDTHRSDVGVRDENEEEQEGEQEGEVAGEDKQPGGGSTSGEAGSRADGDGVHFATENAVSAAVRQWDREDLGGHQAAGKGRGGPAEQQSAPSGAHDAGEDQDGGQAAVSLPSAPAPSGVTGPHAVAGVGVAGAGRATPGVRAMDSSGHDGVDVGAGREGEGETGMRPRGAAGAGRGQGGGHVERWIEVQAEVGEGDGDGDGDVEGSGVGRGAAVDEVGLAEEVEVMAEAVARARAAEELRRRVSRRRMGGELGVGEELLDSVDVEAEDAEGGSESNGSASESGSGVEGISEGGAGEDGEDGDVDVAGESAEGTGRDSNE